jgi:serine/threonine-protein kinase
VSDPALTLATALGNRYCVRRELGRGATATVYLADDLSQAHSVAIKVLHRELAAVVGPERFLREIRVTEPLVHPNIVPLLDSGSVEGLLFYVMPYIEGGSLRDRMRQEVQLGIDEALRIADDVAGALSYAHGHGLVHRDIKPENVLLAGDTAVVADFGIARAVEEASTDRLTETGLAVGTPSYMSPEQGQSNRRVDGRSDIYSLCCVLYEMLAGEPPYTGSTSQAILAKHMQSPIPDVRVVRPMVSTELTRALQRGLAKVPADRYPSMEAFRAALSSAARAPRQAWSRRLPLSVAGAAAVATALLLLRGGAPEPAADATVPASARLDIPRIAVLYFDAQGADSTQRQVADELTEELILELSGVSAFRVVSRNGVRPYRDRRANFDSMVAALSVGTVIDGSVERSGDRLTVRAQLIDARSNTQIDSLWLERAVPPSGPVRGVAQELAAGVRRLLGREVRLRQAGLGAGAPGAVSLARKAQRTWEDARSLAEHPHPRDAATALAAFGQADSLLGLATAVDTAWNQPLVDRGWIALSRAQLLTGKARLTTIRAGLEFAERAVERAPTSAEALELRGVLRWQLVTELQDASEDLERLNRVERDLRAALDRDSTRAKSWATLSDLLWFRGNTAQAGLAARRAQQEDAYLDEARAVLVQLFYNDLMLGEFSRAGQWCERGRWMFPKDWRFVECDLTLMRHDIDAVPRPDSAWALVRLLDRLDPPDRAGAAGRPYHIIYRRVVAATISARAGRHGIARRELERARRAAAADSVLQLDLGYDEAYLRLVLGEPDSAIALLRAYIEARPAAREYLARDPLFRGLRLDAITEK